MKVLVAGATGQTGRRVVKTLLEQGYEVKALVRDRPAAVEILPPEVELVAGDIFKPAELKVALPGCDRLICALGAKPGSNLLANLAAPMQVDFVGTKNVIDAAKEAKIEHFVFVTSLCVSKFFHPLNLFGLVLYWKQRSEAYLKDSELTYTIVRPGGLRNEDNSVPVVMKQADTLSDGRIPRLKVAQVCVAALSEPTAKNTIVEIITDQSAPEKPWSEHFQQVASA